MTALAPLIDLPPQEVTRSGAQIAHREDVEVVHQGDPDQWVLTKRSTDGEARLTDQPVDLGVSSAR